MTLHAFSMGMSTANVIFSLSGAITFGSSFLAAIGTFSLLMALLSLATILRSPPPPPTL